MVPNEVGGSTKSKLVRNHYEEPGSQRTNCTEDITTPIVFGLSGEQTRWTVMSEKIGALCVELRCCFNVWVQTPGR